MPESKKRKKTSVQQTRTPKDVEKAKEPSPTWYVALMAGLMLVGVVLVLIRFIFSLNQYYMFIGLAAIAAGFLMTTNYR